MRILAIDPGSEQSAYLSLDDGSIAPEEFAISENDYVRDMLRAYWNQRNCHLVVEMIASYGMPVGREVFETCLWIGRFVEAWDKPYTLIYRRDVKLHLCNSAKAKDSNIRQALLDRYGKEATKGLKKDLWAALAVATYFADTRAQEVAL